MALPRWIVVASLVLLLPAAAQAVQAEAEKKPQANDEQAKPALSQQQLYEKLQTELTGAKLIGSFTVSGKEDQPPKSEQYTILSAIKVPEEEHIWLLKARIQYGNKDMSVPIPLEIRWAGDTPVITLTNLEIPGLGTFTSRVVIYEGRYAGTWQHGDVGGHLFGRIEKSGQAQGESPP